MFYLLQQNIFKETHYDQLIEFLGKFGLDHEIIRFVPFVQEIEHKTKRKDVWCWGSVNMAHAAKKYGWHPGSMYNDNHDYKVYAPEYGFKNMLNGDGHIMRLTDPLPESYDFFFARPTKDTKSFSGQCFARHAWEDWVKTTLENGTERLLTEETEVLVAPLKQTQQEVRCWVVKGKVITASRYKIHNRVEYKNYDDEAGFVEFAQSMVDKYQPAEAFVIDVCLCEDEYKIVEINCINCSGFYHVNMYKLLEAIEFSF